MSDEQPAAAWSYQPGDWFGVFGPDLTLLLPGSEKARVTGLWELVDGGASFDQVLDGLLSSGLSGLSGFVLIGTESAADPDPAARQRRTGGDRCRRGRGRAGGLDQGRPGPSGRSRAWRP